MDYDQGIPGKIVSLFIINIESSLYIAVNVASANETNVISAIILLAAYATCLPAKEANTCAKACPADYKPICAKPVEGNGTDITFGSNCVMENYNCEHKDKREC